MNTTQVAVEAYILSLFPEHGRRQSQQQQATPGLLTTVRKRAQSL